MTILRRSLLPRRFPPARRRSWRKILSGASAGAIVAGTLRSRKSPGTNPNKLLRTNMISFCRLAKVLPNSQITRRRCERSGTCMAAYSAAGCGSRPGLHRRIRCCARPRSPQHFDSRRAERLADVEQVQAQVRSAVLLQRTLGQSHFVFAITAAQANHVKPDGASQIDDALGYLPHRHRHARGGVGILLGNRAPRRSAVVIRYRNVCSMCPPRPFSNIVIARCSFRASNSGASQLWLGANSCTCLGRPARNCPPMGVGSIRSSGTDCRCINVVRVGDGGLFQRCAACTGDPARCASTARDRPATLRRCSRSAPQARKMALL